MRMPTQTTQLCVGDLIETKYECLNTVKSDTRVSLKKRLFPFEKGVQSIPIPRQLWTTNSSWASLRDCTLMLCTALMLDAMKLYIDDLYW